MTTVQIVGLREIHYIAKKIHGHNTSFEEYLESDIKHVVFAKLGETKLAIALEMREHECGSGWCVSCTCYITVDEVSEFGPMSYIPRRPLSITLPLEISDGTIHLQCVDTLDNEVFYYSHIGGDAYYPSGYYTIDLDNFEKTARCKETRPVWIWKGQSGAGKSYLSQALVDDNITVYETDSCVELPDHIYADVIVLGNKYAHSVEEIKKRLIDEPEVYICEFAKLE
jgi:hypothetical protein